MCPDASQCHPCPHSRDEDLAPKRLIHATFQLIPTAALLAHHRSFAPVAALDDFVRGLACYLTLLHTMRCQYKTSNQYERERVLFTDFAILDHCGIKCLLLLLNLNFLVDGLDDVLV